MRQTAFSRVQTRKPVTVISLVKFIQFCFFFLFFSFEREREKTLVECHCVTFVYARTRGELHESRLPSRSFEKLIR